jgi:uncharacterized protein (TIGR02391 family)
MLSLMYRAGLKAGQVSALERTGYDPATRQLVLPPDRKGNRASVLLDPESATALDEWIAERRRLDIRSSWLFCAILRETRGNQLKTNRMRHILEARGKRAGIDRRVRPEGIRQSGQTYRAPAGALSASELHPRIAEAASQLLTDGHYDSAVREGALALRDVLRARSGLGRLDGVPLAQAALGGESPPIVVADIETRDGKAEQAGWAALAHGCFAALRNAVAHRKVQYTRLTAIEALATMSLVARRVDAAGGPTDAALD